MLSIAVELHCLCLCGPASCHNLCRQRKRSTLALLPGTHCRLTVDPLNFSALLSVVEKPNLLASPTVNVNTQPSLCQEHQFWGRSRFLIFGHVLLCSQGSHNEYPSSFTQNHITAEKIGQKYSRLLAPLAHH